jgi:hypothetical protein
MAEFGFGLKSVFSEWRQSEINFNSSRFFFEDPEDPETNFPLLPEDLSLSYIDSSSAIYDYLELNLANEHMSADTILIKSELEPNVLRESRTQRCPILKETRDDPFNESVPLSTDTGKTEFKFGMSATMNQPVLYCCPIEECPASFTRSNNMKDHLLMKHLDINVREEYPEVFLRYPKNAPKLWICPFGKCYKAYSLKSNMLQHARGKHPHFKLPTYAQDSQRRSLPISQEDYRRHKPTSNLTPKPLPKPSWTLGTTVMQALPPFSHLGYLPQAAGPPTNFLWQTGGTFSVSPPFIPSSLDRYMPPYPLSLLYHPAWIYAGIPQPSFAFAPQ